MDESRRVAVEPHHIAVGSHNPTKVDAVCQTFSEGERTIEPVSVDSGVSEQPRSIGETIDGAETRARNALAAVDADFGVGLEGGVARLGGRHKFSLIMWAAITDGERTGRGSGPAIALPETVSKELAAGRELGPVMNEVLGRSDVARTDGAIGVLTSGSIDRTEALASALQCARGPFVSGLYDDQR